MSGEEPENNNKTGGFSISNWVNSLTSALGFNMKSMSSANTNAEMEQIAQHNEQQSANLEKTESGVKKATAIAGTIVAAPLVAAATPEIAAGVTGFTVETSALKGIISAGTQAIMNKGDVDVFNVVTDMCLAPGIGSSTLGAAVDINPFRPDNHFGLVGINKTIDEFVIDAGTSYMSESVSGKAMKNLSPYLKEGSEQVIFNKTFSTSSSFLGGGINQAIKKKFNE